MDLIYDRLEELQKECPSPLNPEHTFFEVVIPLEFGGNGEDVITFKKVSWQNTPDRLPRFRWEIFKYPGFPRQSEEDETNYNKWKVLQEVGKALKASLKKGKH